MEALRRLLPSRSFCVFTQSCSSWTSSALEGIGGSLPHFSEQKVPKNKDDVIEDYVGRLQSEFEIAKQCFLKIPQTLQSMPKMNFEGIYVNKNLRLDNVQVYRFDYEHLVNEAVAGLAADGRQIVARAKSEATNYESVYGEAVPVKELADRVSSYVHLCTLYWWLRPFGCGVILGGYDRDGPQLYMAEPSGILYIYFGAAIGKGKQAAKTEIEKLKLSEMTCREGIIEVAKIIYMVHDEAKDKALELERSWICNESKREHQKDSLGRGDSWRRSFDVVIAKANKPDFYKLLNKRMFSTSTNRFNYVETSIKNFKYAKRKEINPDTDLRFTIHNLIGKPPVQRVDIPEYQESLMSEELLNEIQKDWICLQTTRKIIKKAKSGKKIEKSKEVTQLDFIIERYNHYGRKTTLFNGQEEFYKRTLQLKKDFNLEVVVPKIARALSLNNINKNGSYPIHLVKTEDFAMELATTLNCGLKLKVEDVIERQIMVEIELKLDKELNKLPPSEANIVTKGLNDYILV